MNKINNYCESFRGKYFVGDDFYSYTACNWLSVSQWADANWFFQNKG